MPQTFTLEEVQRHNTDDDCWMILNGDVYDMTSFLNEHPGGKHIIAKYAGQDATLPFLKIHPLDIIQNIGKHDQLYRGKLKTAGGKEDDKSNRESMEAMYDQLESEEVRLRRKSETQKHPLHMVINTMDMRELAYKVMPTEGWDYYSSGADDEFALRNNQKAFQQVWFRPKVLFNVQKVNTRTHEIQTTFGTGAASKVLHKRDAIMPVYISATALARLAHPRAETAIVRAATKFGVPYMLPTLSSSSLGEMLDAARDAKAFVQKSGNSYEHTSATSDAGNHAQIEQVIWFQLYVNSNRSVIQGLLQKAQEGGCTMLFVTVDAPMLGRREKDMRNKAAALSHVQTKGDAAQQGQMVGKQDQGVSRALSQFIDPSFSWADLEWLKSLTTMPITLKGVQRAEDALRAVHLGFAGVVLSNHGGRQLEYARSGIEVLVEVHAAFKQARVPFEYGAKNRFLVYVDGGIIRGTDVVKCLCLGAAAVGIGRVALYGLAAFGEEGVTKVLQILKDEIETSMALVGATCIEELTPDLLVLRDPSWRGYSIINTPLNFTPKL